MTDADPEHEVGDTPSPTYRDIISPDADAGEEQIENTECAKSSEGSGNRNGNPPP